MIDFVLNLFGAAGLFAYMMDWSNQDHVTIFIAIATPCAVIITFVIGCAYMILKAITYKK